MTQATLVAALVLAATSVRPVDRPARGGTDGLPSALRARIGKTRAVSPCSVSSLPEPVLRAVSASLQLSGGRLSDPGETWNSSDLGRPGAQLAGIARSDRFWVVDARRGGIGVTYWVVVIEDGDPPTVIWEGRCHGGAAGGKGGLRCEENAGRTMT
jgi:hypothetical protein